MGKQSREAIRVVSRVLLEATVGRRIPTTAVFGQMAGVGFGTVQSALLELEEAGAITVTSHGAHGRILKSRDCVALWQAGNLPLIGSMPHPQSREFEGLATALSRAAATRGLLLQLMFRQGSLARLHALSEGRADFALLSLGAAQNAEGIDYIPLSSHTFYGEDAVVVITPSGGTPRYSGIVPADLDSYDHQLLSRTEFAQCQLVHVPYQLIPERIASREFHSAIWHVTSGTPLAVARGLSIHPLKYPDRLVQETLSVATIAWRESDVAVDNLLKDVLDLEKFEAILREVDDGVIPKIY